MTILRETPIDTGVRAFMVTHINQDKRHNEVSLVNSRQIVVARSVFGDRDCFA